MPLEDAVIGSPADGQEHKKGLVSFFKGKSKEKGDKKEWASQEAISSRDIYIRRELLEENLTELLGNTAYFNIQLRNGNYLIRTNRKLTEDEFETLKKQSRKRTDNLTS